MNNAIHSMTGMMVRAFQPQRSAMPSSTTTTRFPLLGTPGRDHLGLAEESRPLLIAGLGSDDSLLGGSAADLMYGDSEYELDTDGSDWMDGRSGNDTMYGGRGNDSLQGGFGNDVMEGGNGNDVLNGESDHDSISGGAGRDQLYGGSGNDSLSGGEDSDSLVAGAGSDRLFGDAGNDLLDPGSVDRSERDSISGGAGYDSFSLTTKLVDLFNNKTTTKNDYTGNLGVDKAIILDWMQGGQQDKLMLAAGVEYLWQNLNSYVEVYQKGLINSNTGLQMPNDLIAQISPGSSSGLAAGTPALLANIQANTIYV